MYYNSSDIYDLTAGLLVFSVVGANDADAGGVRARHSVYNMVNAGNMAPNMEQLHQIVNDAPCMAKVKT